VVDGRTHLLVGIDTEGDNLWDLSARTNHTFDNIYAMPNLHALFRRHGVRPTYFVTYPVVSDARSVDVLRQLTADGACEIGAHHHAWETPPCTDDDARALRYAMSLPVARFEEQLHALSNAIEAAVASRPISYRSGRLGFAAEHVAGLEGAGYRVESSIAPLYYEAHKGGPDFVDAPLAPYFLGYDSTTRPGASTLLEVPLSSALNRRVPPVIRRLYGRAPWNYTTKRVLRLSRVARVLWLRPSFSSLEDMKALARRIVADGVPVLNLVFHSSEMLVGRNPYNRTDADLQAFVARLEAFLEFATGELNATPTTFAEYRSGLPEPLATSKGNSGP
jgi:peptidoglycan/xylan/chitin deacetylase (PgdA/CDA1 family)